MTEQHRSHRSNEDPTRRRTSTENTKTSTQLHLSMGSVEVVRRYHILRSQGYRPLQMIVNLINRTFEDFMAGLEADDVHYRELYEQQDDDGVSS